jgi:hypothetical protein
MREGGKDLRGHLHKIPDVARRCGVIAFVDPRYLVFGKVRDLQQAVDIETIPFIGGDTAGRDVRL